MANLATLALVATVGGTVMQGIAQYQAGKQQAAALRQREAIARDEAEQARRISREAALEKRKEKRALLARQIVLYAKSGVRPGVGTPLLVGAETERRMEREAQIIQERGVYGWEYGMSQADIYSQQAKAARRKGLWSMGTTFATGLSSAARRYYEFKKPPKTVF